MQSNGTEEFATAERNRTVVLDEILETVRNVRNGRKGEHFSSSSQGESTLLAMGDVIALEVFPYLKDPTDVDEARRTASILAASSIYLFRAVQEGVSVQALEMVVIAAMERIVTAAETGVSL